MVRIDDQLKRFQKEKKKKNKEITTINHNRSKEDLESKIISTYQSR